VDLADLVEGLGLTVGQAEAHRDDSGLALGAGVQDGGQLLLQPRGGDGIGWHNGFGVLDEVTELAVTVLAKRGVQGDRLPGRTSALCELLPGYAHVAGE